MNIIFPEKIKNRSIVVLGAPRTGSTAFCYALSEKFMIENYNEVFNPWNAKKEYRIKRFWNNFNLDTKNITKIFPRHDITQEEFELVIKDSFVISLRRRNLVEQIGSFYLLQVTKKAKYYQGQNPKDNWTIDISKNRLKKSIEMIISDVKLATEREKYADMILYYEDIMPELVNQIIKPYPKPTNYSKLLETIEILLPEYLE